GGEVAEAPRVVDRGYASLRNVNALVRRKERFLVAVRAKPGSKDLSLLEEVGTWEAWPEIAPGVRGVSVMRMGVKWTVTWNDEVAGRNGDGRRAKMKQARDALERVAKGIEVGRVKSRSERDRKVGSILARYGMKRFLRVEGERNGLGFRVEETGVREKKEGGDDGYQVYATTETWLGEQDVVTFYRHRDRIEKAIRTMSSVLGLGPMWVQTPEHVRGHVFVHALGY
ncbi:ISMHp1 transposase, partial [mine drainage metagenome]